MAETSGPEPSSSPAQANSPAEASIGLDLRGRIGQPSDAGQIEIFGTKLPEGTPYVLEFFGPRQTLEQGLAPKPGNISSLVPVPTGLAPGSYTIVFRAQLPSGSTLVLHRMFVVGEDGTLDDIGTNIVGETPATTILQRLAYTGVQSSALPWWALGSLLLGALMVAYSVRAHRLVELALLESPRTPWEILATPIRVPGIDYVAGSSGGDPSALSLSESIRELDLALSRMIVERLGQLARTL